VQEHGGSLRAEANSPKGARFLLRLPLMEPPESTAQTAHSIDATGGAAPIQSASLANPVKGPLQ
jgi:hypothetical protein